MEHQSKRGMAESVWAVARRCLALINHLQQGPASKQELLDTIYRAEDPTASASALAKRFDNDKTRLWENLGVRIRYDKSAGGYVLVEWERPLLNLPDAQLETLAFLADTFREGTPRAPEVQQLIDILLPRLSPERRRVVQRARGLLDVDLRQRDSDEIAPDVWAAVQEAHSARQQLAFDYLSSQYEDGLPRHTIVEPWEFYFDTTRGHYYVRGYCLWRDGPDGPSEPRAYRHYRVGRIQAGSATVLSQKLPPIPRAARRYAAAYELAPEIARLGVSRQPEPIGESLVKEMDEG